jgi:poly(3-hydroxybutyrate) depolymerase
VTKLFDKVGADRVVLVWSLWRGYWERGGSMREWAARRAVEPLFIHSGGHAWPEDLDRLEAAVAPKHKPVRVHTDASFS